MKKQLSVVSYQLPVVRRLCQNRDRLRMLDKIALLTTGNWPLATDN